MPPAVAVFGSLNMDLVTRVPRRPEVGETVTGDSFELTPGGKGLNQAIAAARAGVGTSMLGSVGDDTFGKELSSALTRDDVDVSGVQVHPSAPTGTAQVTVYGAGDNSIVVVAGANGTQAGPDEPQSDLIRQASCLLLQMEVPPSSSIEAARTAKAAGTTVVLNPAPFQPLPPELLQCVDVLIVNESEARSLAQREAPPPVLLRKLKAVASTVIITLGSKGCVWRTPKRSGTTAAPAVDVVDTTGAGDTFCGYLGAQLAEGVSMEAAIATAGRAAALSVLKSGASASIPRIAEL